MVEASPKTQQSQDAAQSIKKYIALFKEAQGSTERVPEQDLVWTERMSYQLYKFDQSSKQLTMANDAQAIIQLASSTEEIDLDYAYGDWVVAIKPEQFLGACSDEDYVAACQQRIQARRTQLGVLADSASGASALALAQPLMLGKQEGTVGQLQRDFMCRIGLSESSVATVPRYADEQTEVEDSLDAEQRDAGRIELEGLGHALGCGQLEISLEAQSLNHARFLHDMLVPWVPIFMALSAASPIQKGELSLYDHSWPVLEQMTRTNEVDDEDQMGQESASQGRKARYSAAQRYISNHQYVQAHHNNTHTPNEELLRLLETAGVEDKQFQAYLASKLDHLQCPEQTLTLAQDPTQPTLATPFDSADLNGVGIKPILKPDGTTRWLVVLRQIELQPTDQENAALSTCVAMLCNVINTLDLDFLMPLELVQRNLERACAMNAAREARFYWKMTRDEYKDLSRLNDLEESNFEKSNASNFGKPSEHDSCVHICDHNTLIEEKKLFKEVKIGQILEGDSRLGLSKGLITLVEEYMDMNDWEEEQQRTVLKSFELLLARANGQIPTPATFFRSFVRNHASYGKDSAVNDAVAADLLGVVRSMEDSSSAATKIYLGQFA